MNSRKRTNEWFVNAVRKQVGNEYTFLEPYDGTDTKIKCCHNSCGHCWSVTPYHFLRGHTRCPLCSNKLSEESFIRKLNHVWGNRFVPLESYKGMTQKIAFFHQDCGQVVYTTPSRLIHSHKGCNRCALILRACIKIRKSHHKFKQWLKNNPNPDYKLFKTIYKGTHTPYKYTHKCGWIGTTSPKELMQHGWRCYQCKGKQISKAKLWRLKEFKQEVYKKTNDFEIIGPYTGAHDPIAVRHRICGRISHPIAGGFLHSPYCSRCSESANEMLVEHVLDKLNIKYITQKRFADCRYKRPLPFDFYLPDYNTCIEYDGQQHFYPINFSTYKVTGATVNRFYVGKWRDHLKTIYCIKHHIKLIRIPYSLNTFNKISQYIRKGVM